MRRRAEAVVASYLIGTFPTAALIGRALGWDVHAEGSGNPGASNTYRVAGPRAGALVLAVDMAKGIIPTLAGRRVGGGPLGAVCGAAATVGHCFPVPVPAKGGKGVATAAGMVLVVDPRLALGAAATWAVVAKLLHRPSVASISVTAGLPLAAAVRRRPAWEIATFAAVGGLVLARHEDNLRRLLRGEEPALA
jgi:glycerol-3-phosphate acyltransferase PlsY